MSEGQNVVPAQAIPAIAAQVAAPHAKKGLRREHGYFAGGAGGLAVTLALGWSSVNDKLTDMRLSLTRIEAHEEAGKAVSKRMEAELKDVVGQLREIDRDRARDGEQLRELERRVGAVEGKR